MLLAFRVTGVEAEAGFTLMFAAISIVLGVWILRYGIRNEPNLTLKRRVVLIVIGIVALFSWSGLYFGTALAIASASIPLNVIQNK